MLCRQHWLFLDFCVDVHLILTYKVWNGLGPIYLRDCPFPSITQPLLPSTRVPEVESPQFKREEMHQLVIFHKWIYSPAWCEIAWICCVSGHKGPIYLTMLLRGQDMIMAGVPRWEMLRSGVGYFLVWGWVEMAGLFFVIVFVTYVKGA